MPKEPRQRLTKDLAQREPKVKRSLPSAVFDRLQAGRDSGKPYRYTTKDVRAIIRYVSRYRSTDDASYRFPTASEYAEHSRKAREFGEFYANERKKDLLDRIEKPSLVERLTALPTPAPTPIAPKLPVIDFKKQTPEALQGIFKVKIEATLRRLQILEELEARFTDQIVYDQFRAVQRIVEKLKSLQGNLEILAPGLSHAQWQQLDWGLKRIGTVSFKGLRRNLTHVYAQLYHISRDCHFEWI